MRWTKSTMVAAAAIAAAVGCGPKSPSQSATPGSALADLRDRARGSSDPDTVGRWAVAELVDLDGDAAHAASARKRLDEVKAAGLWAELGRGLYDDAHGQPRTAAAAFVGALAAAAGSNDPDAPLVAWLSMHRLIALRGSVAELYAQHRAVLEQILSRPGNVGWRALSELQDWWANEVFDKAEQTGEAYEAAVAAKMGCSTHVKFAGPFGSGSTQDRRRSWAAERPGPWPPAWPADPIRGTIPKQIGTERHRCLVVAAQAAPEGIFYAETFFSAPNERELLVAAQGAVAIWVDDAPVLQRDPADWGSWQRFGALVRVGPGRHRVLARVPGLLASIRLLNRDGTAADVATDADDAAPYALGQPAITGDPNPIAPVLEAKNGAPPLRTYLAAEAAHADGLDDVASVLIEPLVTSPRAAPLALVRAADFAQEDPALPDEVKQRTAKGYREQAVAKDARYWYARMRLTLADAEQRGPIEAVDPLKKMVDEFKEEPLLLEELARLYGALGWRAERMQALAELAQRFPDDVNALRAYLGAIESDGALGDADKLATRIKRLDPDAEVDLDRAIARHDWPAAIAELKRLAARRPDRKEIATRIADVLSRAGDPSAAMAQLKTALAKRPADSQARFRLADDAYAKGDDDALRKALADAMQLGADTSEMRAAIDLLEGATDLEPYRIDGRAMIKQFEAWEKAGNKMDGTAARVLDYGATWVHPDGSSEMLEHEIQKIQSQEAIEQEANIAPPTGLLLRLRVIKPDGSTLEPEHVAGKPTLTFPHLEVGDYIELEHITPTPGDGMRGRHYGGPRWFFREPDKGYWNSQFVVVVPKDKTPLLEIEKVGNVGEDKTKDLGMFVEHRWEVDLSPPAPSEPERPPETEFLPSVRVGWGITLEDTLRRLVDLAVDDTPLDPRLRRLALDIVKGTKDTDSDERARILYRWVMDKVQPSQENDGRRALLGRTGSPQSAFQHLLRQLGIPYELALVTNGLALPPRSKMAEAENFDGLLMRLSTDKGVRWLLMHDKFEPYGYVPANYRGQQAYRLIPDTPKDVVSTQGALDAVDYGGRADVKESGGASMDLAITFTGRPAILWRTRFAEVPEPRREEFVEKAVVAPLFDGGSLREMHIDNLDTVDAPLVLHVKIEVPQLVKPAGGNFSLGAVFPQGLDRLAPLPTRQTPVLRRQSWHTEVHLQVVLPQTVRMPSQVQTGEVRYDGCIVSVKDSIAGHAIKLDRVIDLPAGRVQPGDDYAKYQQFARDADALYEHETLLGK